jgi:integrase
VRIYPEGTTQFLKDRASDIRTPASREDYRKVLRHFQNFIPTKSIHHVKLQDCINYLNQANQRTGKPLAPNTVLARKTTLTAFFGWANWKGLTTATPMAGIENVVKPKAKNVTQGRWLGDAERKMLLAGCPDDFVGQRDRVLLMLGMFCGLRREDLAKVRWGDIQGTSLLGKGKGEKPFEVRLLGPLAEAVMLWRAEWVKGAGRFPTSTDPLFPRMRSQWGAPDPAVIWHTGIGTEGVARAVVRAGLRVGMDIAPHDLRRTFAGLLEDQGVPIEKISAALRHSDIGTTQRYLADNPRRTIEALDGVVIEL